MSQWRRSLQCYSHGAEGRGENSKTGDLQERRAGWGEKGTCLCFISRAERDVYISHCKHSLGHHGKKYLDALLLLQYGWLFCSVIWFSFNCCWNTLGYM